MKSHIVTELRYNDLRAYLIASIEIIISIKNKVNSFRDGVVKIYFFCPFFLTEDNNNV